MGLIQDELIESIDIQTRSVIPDCETSLKDEILSALQNNEIINECHIISNPDTNTIKIYIPDTL